MARLRTWGAEWNQVQGDGIDLGSPPTAGVTVQSSVVRSGTYAYALTSNGSTAAKIYFASFSGATATHYFVRSYVRWTGNPSRDFRVLGIETAANADVGSVYLKTNGTLELRVGANVIGTAASGLSADTWYRVELRSFINGAAGADDYIEFHLDGSQVAIDAARAITTAAPTLVVSGDTTTTSLSATVYLDDLAINDDSGASQNSWPGNGNVLLLVPTADAQRGSWTGGAGGTTNLWDAVNNKPPTGTASETDSTQIESADSSGNNSTDEYRATMQTYTAAGASGSLVVGQTLLWHGEDAATGTKTGSVLVASNPTQGAADTFTFGDNVGALGTFPTNWRFKYGAALDISGATAGTAPVIHLRKTDAVTTVGSVTALGFYFEYAVSNAVTGTAANSQVAQTSSASGALGFEGTVANTQVVQTSAAEGTYTPLAIDGDIDQTQEPQHVPVAADDFAQMVSPGWGEAEFGGTWVFNDTDGVFADGSGWIENPDGVQFGVLDQSDAIDHDIYVLFSTTATGAEEPQVFVLARALNGFDDHYDFLAEYDTGQLAVHIRKVVGGTPTVLDSDTSLAFASDTFFVVRFRVVGTSSTVLQAKVWVEGEFEPDDWLLDTTDSQAALQVTGPIGLGYGDNSGTTATEFSALTDRPNIGYMAEAEEEAFTGTIAQSQQPQTSDATGLYTPLAITGTIAQTQAAQTSAAEGTALLAIDGDIAQSQQPQTSAAEGTALLAVEGEASQTQAPQTQAASGIVANPVEGEVAQTQAAQTSAATGAVQVDITGNIDQTQQPQTQYATGVVPSEGGHIPWVPTPYVPPKKRRPIPILPFVRPQPITGRVSQQQEPQEQSLVGRWDENEDWLVLDDIELIA